MVSKCWCQYCQSAPEHFVCEIAVCVFACRWYCFFAILVAVVVAVERKERCSQYVSLENSRLIQSKIELRITQLLMPQERNQSHQSNWMDFFAFIANFSSSPHMNIRKSNSTADILSFGVSHTPHTHLPRKNSQLDRLNLIVHMTMCAAALSIECAFCECGHNMLLNFSSPQQHKSHFFRRSFSPSKGAAVWKNHPTPF